MKDIPQYNSLDSTFAVASDGYTFISKRCRKLDSDIFLTRVMFQKTICMRGSEAAEMFYNPLHFERKNVAPNMVKATLFGHGGVQALDDGAHRNRKVMFMSLMGRDSLARLSSITTNKWNNYAEEWEKKEQVTLFHEVQKLLSEAVCEWSGIPVDQDEIDRRARDLGDMIDGAGTVSPRHWQARLARVRSEKWIEELIKEVRSENNPPEEGQQSALQRFSWHKDTEGKLLDSHTAAVEILNILRPTVAVARYITFAALALHTYPETREKILHDDEYIFLFVDEVRRFYPFFPFVMARVKKEFEWKNYHFPMGRNVLLDLYGTNHHPQQWEKPDEFNPDRFRNSDKTPFNLIPQGGGDYHKNHRCAGEWVTIELLKGAVRFLTGSLQYDVPEQDLHIDLTRMPAIPESRFIIENVKKVSNRN